MTDYLVIEESTYTQDAWQVEKAPDGRPLSPVRPFRDEVRISVRLDRQFMAILRLPSAAVSSNKQLAIANACSRAAVGQEIAPGIQVVEYEAILDAAQKGFYSPPSQDKGGKAVPEQYQAPSDERLHHRFAIRRNGADLFTITLEDSEFRKGSWRVILRNRVPVAESFSVGV